MSAAVLSNARALLFLQALNIGLPLAVLPFLTRATGVDLYGVIAFGLSCVQFSQVVTDFGFSLYGTLVVSKSRGRGAYLASFNAFVLLAKLLLAMLAATALAIIPHFRSSASSHPEFFYALAASVVLQALYPMWLLQGLEKMGLAAVSTAAGRSFYAIVVITAVRTEDDIAIVPFALAAGHLIALLLAAFGLEPSNLSVRFPPRRFIVRHWSRALEYFWARLAVAAYGPGSTLLLGLTVAPRVVALYSVADQIYRGLHALVAPIAQALYPHMARKRDYQLYWRYFRRVMVAVALGCVVLGYSATALVTFIFGIDYATAASVVRVLILTFFFASASVMIGYPLLGACGHARTVNRSVMIAGGTQATLLVGVALSGQASGLHVAFTVLVSELVVFALRWHSVFQNRLIRYER